MNDNGTRLIFRCHFQTEYSSFRTVNSYRVRSREARRGGRRGCLTVPSRTKNDNEHSAVG